MISGLAWIGNYQAVAQLIPRDWEWFRNLPIPHWPWQVSLAITMITFLFFVVHAATKVIRSVEERYERERIALKNDYDQRVMSLDRQALGDSRPLFALEEMPRYDEQQLLYPASEANLRVHNLGNAPIRVRATGKLVSGNVQIRNLNRPYGIKWQGTNDDEVEILGGMSEVLNVVEYRLLCGRVPIWGLIFHTSRGHASGRDFFFDARHPSRMLITDSMKHVTTETIVCLAVEGTAVVSSDRTRIARVEQVFEIRAGKGIESLSLSRRLNEMNR